MSPIVRPMTIDDVAIAAQVQVASFDDYDRRFDEPPEPERTDAAWSRIYDRHRHFVTHDPDGSWVAVEGDRVIGVALALRRGSLWGLSLLAVDPTTQSGGAGRQLIDAVLTYAEGCDRAVIVSSADPRAIRLYATSGFDLHPHVEGRGVPDRSAIPASHCRVRDGSTADFELADSIDRSVRGAPRGPDHAVLAGLRQLFVIDDVDGRGYAYIGADDGDVYTVAASDDDTATALLWRCVAHAAEIDKPAGIFHINARQQWALRVAFAARLRVKPDGPVFWRGIAPPPSYLISGGYL